MDPIAGGLAPIVEGDDAAPGNGLLKNLVAYWGLDEAGGANNALDKHSNGLTLTQANSPGSATGLVYAGARTFDGTTHFYRASEALLQMGDNDFTFAIWVFLQTPASGIGPILSKYLGAGDQRSYMVDYEKSSDKFRFSLSTNGTSGTTTTLSTSFTVGSLKDRWTYIFASYNATTNLMTLAIDDRAANTATQAGGAFASTGNLEIGRGFDNFNYFKGRIGPVAMWKSAPGNGGVLSAAQRTALYNAGTGLAYSAFTL